ncbi:conserved exported hypothetical protein [Vibrio chagasii]|nr:conserved exported hypothetical protein [Vibrio chagasii]
MNKKIITRLSPLSVAVLAGCSNMHTADYTENKEMNVDRFEEIEKSSSEMVTSITAGTIVDDFFVDTTPFSVPNDRSTEIPRHLPENIRFLKATQFSEADLKTTLLDDYGIRIDFTRLIAEEGDEESEDSSDVPFVPPTFTDHAGTEVFDEKAFWEENSNPEAASLFGNYKESDDSLLPPLDYNGSLVDFIEMVSAQTGLSWKYDSVDNIFVFYDLDTKVFQVVDNTQGYKSELSISTEAESESSGEDDSGSMTSSTNQSVEYTSSGDHWSDLSGTVESLLTEHGIATFDQKNGYITVTDKKSVLSKVDSLINVLNTANKTMVFLDVTYVKVTLDKESGISIDLNADSFFDKVFSGVEGGYVSNGGAGGMSSVLGASFTKSGIDMMIGSMGRYGTVSTRYEMPITTLNNTAQPYQTVLEQKYISKVEKTTDDNGDTSWSTDTEYNKTGLTSLFTPRVFQDNVLINGRLSISENIEMREHAEAGITLPTNASETHIVNTIIPNGVTKIVSIQKIETSQSSANGPLGEHSVLLGGSESSGTKQEVSMIMVTPYILN